MCLDHVRVHKTLTGVIWFLSLPFRDFSRCWGFGQLSSISKPLVRVCHAARANACVLCHFCRYMTQPPEKVILTNNCTLLSCLPALYVYEETLLQQKHLAVTYAINERLLGEGRDPWSHSNVYPFQISAVTVSPRKHWIMLLVDESLRCV